MGLPGHGQVGQCSFEYFPDVLNELFFFITQGTHLNAPSHKKIIIFSFGAYEKHNEIRFCSCPV